jgi:ADP-heptose:LPS heptosyltransferase
MKYFLKKIAETFIRIVVNIFRLLRVFKGKNKHGVIIVKIDHLGDFILFSPALKYYRDTFAGENITLVVNEASRDIAQRYLEDGYFNNMIIYSEKKFRKSPRYQLNFLFKLSKYSYKIALYPTYSRSMFGDLVMKAIYSSEKIGFKGNCSNQTISNIRKNGRIYTKLIDSISETELGHNLNFLNSFGAQIGELLPSFQLRPDDLKQASKVLEESGVQNKYCVVFPGAHGNYKIWPIEKFSQLSKYLVKKGVTPVVCGSDSEYELAHKICEMSPGCINLAGKTEIFVLAGILKKALFYIGSDTGILHLSAAVRTPSVAIMGGGHLGRFFPYGIGNKIVYNKNAKCINDNWRCVRDSNKTAPCISSISLQEVILAIEPLISPHE